MMSRVLFSRFIFLLKTSGSRSLVIVFGRGNIGKNPLLFGGREMNLNPTENI